MICYKFDEFVFDVQSYQLTYRNKPLAVRPKALILLVFLISNRERVVSKSEIYRDVWGNPHERDHVLFQLVSELRKPPFSKTFIRTLPNQGYQWVVKTQQVKRPLFSRSVATVSLVLGLSLLGALLYKPSQSAPNTIQMPAQTALSKGVLALNSGDTDHAIEMFKFALAENPDSVEASLFLVEGLMKQDKAEESSRYLEKLLRKPNLGEYSRMSASSLMSQVMESQGRLDAALRYAQRAQSAEVVAQCSVEAVDERVQGLTMQLSKVTDTPVTAKTSVRASNAPKVDEEIPESKLDPCSALEPEPVKTSYCAPDTDAAYYVGVGVGSRTPLYS
ncbi:hypothetical protein GCM10008090_07640 [Arenicella chitinivorans]|uniref:OmpR/PhoB-type domain-containing protein n=1 Tax=Arenicella chitinivorans TaxID=1329800 RepID=A0A918VIY8_9GAMM|nr:winged helix-turn-helix domain-containing protein [Arenicella chitinivorans]GHA01026.1 hypothetical protein GCM10008090_07640 [Arenicella chitinivorans]